MTDGVEPTTPAPAGAPTPAPGAEDATEVDALRRLGLDALLGDQEGGGARWPDVEDQARRANRRRSQVAAVAAAIVLVLVVGAGALIARAGQESSTPAGPSGEPRYVLPPEGTEVLSAFATLRPGRYLDPDGPFPRGDDVTGYTIRWSEPSSGDKGLLIVMRPESIALPGDASGSTGALPSAPSDADALASLVSSVFSNPANEVVSKPLPGGTTSGLDPAIISCIGNPPESSYGMVMGVLDRYWIVEVDGGGQAESGPCTADSDDHFEARRASRALRLADEDEWREFMDRYATVSPPASDATSAPPTTTDPAVADYCEAIERYRGAGLTDPSTGGPSAEALPYLEAIRDAAPDDMRPAFEAVVSWLADGAPAPMPSDVAGAMLPMTQDWVNRCQGRPG
jgi:hypothetical protein